MYYDRFDLFLGTSSSKFYKKTRLIFLQLPNVESADKTLSASLSLQEVFLHYDAFTKIINAAEYWTNFSIKYNGDSITAHDAVQILESLVVYYPQYRPLVSHEARLTHLPFPIAYHPQHYGCYFAFSKTLYSPLFFCECEKESLKNYINMFEGYFNPTDFSELVSNELNSQHIHSVNQLSFFPKICYRCNNQLPPDTYNDYGRSSTFSSLYGWYINQRRYELGVLSTKWVVDLPHDRISDELTAALNLVINIQSNPTDSHFLENTTGRYSAFDSLERAIENDVRSSMGYKPIGESWTSETEMYKMIQSLFPHCEVHFHYRPKWLEGLELDVFIEDKRVGFEYQGIQHFQPVAYWGGTEQLEKQKRRDRLKRQLCKKAHVKIVELLYCDDLSEALILQRMQNLQIDISDASFFHPLKSQI